VAIDSEVNEAERKRWNDEYWTSVWPKREALTSVITPYLLDAAEIRAGQRVLDIGSGAGVASLAAAALVGDGGEVVGADISTPLVAYASRRAVDSASANVRFVVRDVQQEAIEGAPFDAAISQFGVMFFDEPATAFSNIRAQMVSGGTVTFACWQAMQLNQWFVGPALAQFVAPPPPPAPGKSATGPFAFADADLVQTILAKAGWADISHSVHQSTTIVDQDAVIDDGQLSFLGVAEEAFAAAREAVDAHLAPLRRADGRLEAPLAFQIFRARN
jgi:SAM-dependent methyltransferase